MRRSKDGVSGEVVSGEWWRADESPLACPRRRSATSRLTTHHLTSFAMLSINNIEVVYDNVILVLKGVSIEVKQGAITTLLGRQRRRQVDDAEGDLGHSLHRARQHHQGLDHARRQADPRHAALRRHQARHRPGVRGPARLREPDLRREPDGRRPLAGRHGRRARRASSASSRISRASRSAADSSPAISRAASSRCW